LREREKYKPQAVHKKTKCQVCKAKKAEHTVKDGSSEVLVCEKCFRCSKCETNQAIAQKVVSKEGEILYQGSICETCIEALCRQGKQTNTNIPLHTHTHTTSRF